MLSNPPGMTVLAVLSHRAVDDFPYLRRLINKGFALHLTDDQARPGFFARRLFLAILLTVAWGGAVVLGYLLCRLWMPPLAAIAIGLACVLNPATVNFTPGKDPAQVLTVLAILYTGLAGYTRSRRLPCLACGAIFALSLTIGLVHIWVVLILIAATLWQSHRRGPGLSHYLQRVILPAAIGFALVAACLQSLLGWNILKTSLAVVQRYPDVQVNLINGYWTMVGLPMFILFAGPMMWCLATVLRRDRHDSTSSLGRSLVFSSAMVMTFSYFFANNNETPRLWIPFLALLPVGLAMGRDLFRRGSDQHRRICLVMIALQIGVSVLHWSMMDVRESENRLQPGSDGSPPRMWG